MRSGAVAVIALVAAVVGAAAVLGIGSVMGLLGDDGAETVYVPSATPATNGRPEPASRPLVGNGFDPAAIYSDRSPGVVTIYSVFGLGEDHPEAGGQGSG